VAERFPFPSFPRGWFVVAFSHELAAGQVKTVHYFDRDIVLFRTQSGVLSAVDKVCPHLGAHVGGGRVDGECLRCPFHAWGFDATGKCVDVPYAPKIPPKAALRSWPLREQNGAVFVYFDPAGQAPSWDIPALAEDGWTPNQTIRWEIRSHPQEIAENTVDIAHLLPVHDVLNTRVVSLEQREHCMRVVLSFTASGAVIQMPDEVNDVELDVTLHGLGQLISNTHVITAGLRTRQRIHPTPVDRERVAIFALGNMQVMPDPQYTREMDQIFWEAFVADFAKDFPIWENKAYVEQPMLASGDGPIAKYRRWARQFYAYPQAEQAPAENGAPLGVRRRLSQWLGRAARAQEHEAPEAIAVAPRNGSPAPAAKPAQASFASVDAYFAELERRFDPRAAGDLSAVYQWQLTGDNARTTFAEIAGGAIRVSDGVHPAPTVTIEMSSADYLLMINGTLNGALAFSTGRGKLRGPVRLAMKMKSLFPLERVL
jgi:phenylpropionate dioxygenase-like ring-hydroxylating dioxygenase large terminal subunit/putative sterol carrier protein